MIFFFASGTQLAFPRLAKLAVKCASKYPEHCFKFQAGPNGYFASECSNLEVFETVSSEAFNDYALRADVIVSHAGMGNVINFLDKNLKFIMFPRQADLKEHRTNHQIDSAMAINKMLDIPYFLSSEDAFKCIESLIVGEMDLKYKTESIEKNRKMFLYSLQEKIANM